MSEPTLENIEDYDSLKGEKRKVVMAVIVAGLIMGLVYVIAASYYVEKPISEDKAYKTVPMR